MSTIHDSQPINILSIKQPIHAPRRRAAEGVPSAAPGRGGAPAKPAPVCPGSVRSLRYLKEYIQVQHSESTTVCRVSAVDTVKLVHLSVW